MGIPDGYFQSSGRWGARWGARSEMTVAVSHGTGKLSGESAEESTNETGAITCALLRDAERSIVRYRMQLRWTADRGMRPGAACGESVGEGRVMAVLSGVEDARRIACARADTPHRLALEDRRPRR